MNDATATQEYICDECGNTTPIPNEHCPVCGAPMTALGSTTPATKKRVVEGDDDDDIDGTAYNEDGMESLEQLKAKESEEDDEPYGYGNDE